MANDIKKVRWINSLHSKLSISLSLLITVILVGLAISNYFSFKNRMLNDLEKFADITSTQIANYLEIPLWTIDEPQIKGLLESEMLERRIKAIIVRGPGDNIAYGRMRDQNRQVVQVTDDIAHDFIVGKKDILYEKKRNKKLGVVEVYISPKPMQEELQRQIMFNVIAVIVLNIAIFISIFFILKKICIDPLQKLTNAAQRLSEGKLDSSFDIKTKDEIGQLANSLYLLGNSLKVALNRINKHRNTKQR